MLLFLFRKFQFELLDFAVPGLFHAKLKLSNEPLQIPQLFLYFEKYVILSRIQLAVIDEF